MKKKFYVLCRRMTPHPFGPFKTLKAAESWASKNATGFYQIFSEVQRGATPNPSSGFYYAPAPGTRGMLVDITMDRMGDIILEPRSEKVKSQMRAHNLEWSGHADDTVFLQEGAAASEFEEHLTPQERSNISSGWTVTKKFDPWMFGHLVGYDFQEVIDP